MTDYYMEAENGEVIKTNMPEIWTRFRHLPKKEGALKYQAQHAASLRELIKPGTTVYTVLNSVSSSGMSRRISMYIAKSKTKTEPPRIVDITWSAAIAMDRSISDKGGIQVSGCGMDMGFHLVYTLGRALWPKGTRKPHGQRNGEPDKDGGYALNHQWM